MKNTPDNLNSILILVDENDEQTGVSDKYHVHKNGLLHRCFSIFIFNSKGQMLLQKRAASKYHSGGLWTNACCGHPTDGQILKDAAKKRLKEEMGVLSELKEKTVFKYRAELDNDMVEHEMDHVFFGTCDGKVIPNPHEADSFKWVDLTKLLKDVRKSPDNYTVWFKIALEKLYPNNN